MPPTKPDTAERTPGRPSNAFSSVQKHPPAKIAVCRPGGVGSSEAVLVTFDPAVVSYRALADRFWRTIDPTDPTGQVCDQGPSYVTAVYATEAQTATAQASRTAAQAALGPKGSGFLTPVYPAMRFWPAGPEHQDFARRHPARYEAYRIGCGRSARLRTLWGAAALG